MMEVVSAPTTPENSIHPYMMRRSSTAPTKSGSFVRTPPIREPEIEGAETLFAHPAGKIVSFTTSSNLTRRHSSFIQEGSKFQDEPSGTLPWASATERTLAAGPLLIYRVLGSVAFLSSGRTLHPILAKSQCWCVDGESKFVLRIRHDFFYRIELPNTCSDENLKVEEFKIVLARVLQYERTACPFKRGFTVDLPEPPITPVRKRPWKPQQQPSSVSEGNTRMEGSDVEEIADGEDAGNPTSQESKPAYTEVSKIVDQKLAKSSGGSHESEIMEHDSFTLKNMPEIENEELNMFQTPTRPKTLRTGRTVTAPPQLTLRTLPPSNSMVNELVSSKPTSDSSSLSSSAESFHSFHSPISPVAPSPPYPSPPSIQPGEQTRINVSRTRIHKRDSSELTITSDQIGFWDAKNGPTPDEVYTSSSVLPELVSDAASQSEENWSDAITPSPSAEVRQRKAPQRRQPYSPPPSQTNLYSPSCRMSGHHLTTAILQKTCSLLLGPPVQLVALMLNIASKIARGAYRGVSYGYGEAGQKIPCSWEFSDADDDSDHGLEEDDYGFSLGKLSDSRIEKMKDADDSWEID